jgi:hypothetical protein
MDCKEIKGISYYIFENISEFKALGPARMIRNLEVVDNWRKAKEGDWVLTDDDCVVQIIKKFNMKNNVGKKEDFVRTICGTCKVSKNSKMLGKDGIAENIYTIGGKIPKYRDDNDNAFLFARYIAEQQLSTGSFDKVEAYKKAYPKAKEKYYINKRSTQLLKSKKVQNMIDENIKIVLGEEGVSHNYLIKNYKDVVDYTDSDAVKLRSLDSLSKIAGLFETKEKKSEQLTVWAGFTPEQMEAIQDGKNTQLLGHQEKEQK